jgi:hypothetical protein
MKKVTLSDIPVIPFPEPANYIDLALKVKANGEDAIVFISGREHIPFNGDDKIFIVWDTPNQKYGASFVTKYYDIKKPGILEYGYNGDVITLEKQEV